jgi:hypothetical protein
MAEIERIEEATANLYQLFLRAGDAMLELSGWLLAPPDGHSRFRPRRDPRLME